MCPKTDEAEGDGSMVFEGRGGAHPWTPVTFRARSFIIAAAKLAKIATHIQRSERARVERRHQDRSPRPASQNPLVLALLFFPRCLH